MPVTFVYRSHYEGPLSKRIKRFPDASVLAWFQRVWPLAVKAKDPGKVVDRELGVSVYGFDSVFREAKENGLAAPRTLAELEALLDEHLYVEGGFRLDRHTLRVHTDDDEVALAYYLFDDTAAAPDRVAYLLHPKLPLPDGEAAGKGPKLPPCDPRPITPAGGGKGRTYLILLTFSDGESIPGELWSLEGVRVPDLLPYLRDTEPPGGKPGEKFPDTWPFELRLLRASIEPDDRDLLPACRRAAAYPMLAARGTVAAGRAGLGPRKKAVASLEALAAEDRGDGNPKKSIVHVGTHLIQIATHQSATFGHQQWFVFDDRWAAAQPALATSLLRYASSWDPWSNGDDEDDD